MDLFAHRIHKVVHLNGVVRLECSVLKPDAEGNVDPAAPVPPQDVTFTVNMPLQGFLRSLHEMREAASDMAQKGIIKAPEQGGRPGGPGPRGGENRMREQKRLRDLTQDGDGGDDDQLV